MPPTSADPVPEVAPGAPPAAAPPVGDAAADTAPAVPVRRKRRFGAALYDLAVETFAVLLGVSVALLVSDWQADRDGRARAATARASLVEEVRANRAAVAEAFAYHSALLDSLGPRMGPAGRAPSVRLFTRGFIHPARPVRTAWDAAAATGAVSFLPYGEVLTFSRLYASQDEYDDGAEYGGRTIYEALFDRGTFGIVANYRNLFSLIASTRYLEERLLGEYDRALAALDAAPAPVRSDSTAGR